MEKEQCRKSLVAIRDTLDVVGGKWKLILLAVLQKGSRKFNELAKETGISPRILSKELQELEINGLINRKVNNTKPITVEYSATKYCSTLSEFIDAAEKWGIQHRKKIVQK